MFSIEIQDGGVVAMYGRLDASQVEEAERTLSSLESSVVLDLTELQYISSAGIGIILKTYKRLHGTGHTLQLANPSPHVRNIFHYAGLDQILGIE